MASPGTATPRVLIIGCGDSLRGDDAIGRVAAQKLGEKFNGDTRVAAAVVGELTAELAEQLSKVDLAIFIDAVQGQRPGHLSCTFVTPASPQPASATLDPSHLLSLARSLFARTPQAMTFTVAGEDFGHRQTLTRTVDRACERLIDHVYRIVLDELEHSHAAP